ncbi:syncytin-B-like [Rhineura floridana]|uniref:syncytin-B-like n=1 Tax=Rhineura floridana TaxID=261503 RepID=UPI002AC84A2E|nr:syncytin-B-like [Rhineura floridana]XP_061443385.1 syncytin-B-like [Rhineura floridana]XP_061443386.1 syncytin-B-like [Rhineura floridana]
MNPVLQFRLGMVFSGSLILIVFLCITFLDQSQPYNEQSRIFRSTPEATDKINTYVELAKQVAKVFYLKSCWICGNPQGFPQWPWMAIPLNPKWLLSNRSEVHNGTGTWETRLWWNLKWAPKGQYCMSQNITLPIQELGNSKCNWTLQYTTKHYPGPGETITPCALWNNGTHVRLKDDTWAPCTWMRKEGVKDIYACRTYWEEQTVTGRLCAWFRSSKNQSLYKKEWAWHHSNGMIVRGFQKYWAVTNHTRPGCTCVWRNETELWKCTTEQAVLSPLGNESYYIPSRLTGSLFNYKEIPALKGHYWICGSTAYSTLPVNWTGTCYFGIMYTIKGGNLNPLIPVFDEDISKEKKWSIDVSLAKGQDNGWGETWPPERIIATYDPASWAQDGMYGYRTPIYLLNRLIRLQAVVEILTNQTANSLILLADQSTQMREGILQNRLALDYLLAKEGGVCGLLNLTECCLKIDDNGEIVKDVANMMKKLAHVPVQTWKGLDLGDWNSWFNWFGGMNTMVIQVMLILVGCMLLPCLLPIIMNGIRSIADNAATRSSMQLYGKIMYQRVYKEDPWETKGEKKEEPI